MFRIPIVTAALLAPASALAQSASAADLPRALFITNMDGEFRKIDADKDGQLARAEIEQYQRAAAIVSARSRSNALFARLDADRNGQLSAAEFARLPAAPPRVDASAMLRFDTSKDGKVRLIEHRTATLANFDRLDTDKDGVVSAAEMKAGGIRR